VSSIPAAQLQSRLRFQPASGAIIGAREEQEDSARIGIFDTEAGGAALLLIVADGMGGHAGGREASRAAVDAFAQNFHTNSSAPLRPRLRGALDAANEAVAALAAANRELRGMGCTIVAAVLAGTYLRWISVGDSLLLAIKNRQVVRLNADHSLAPELERAVREGRMTQDEADSDPDRHILRSAVTGGRMNLIDEGARRIGEGALVLLATDGILTLPGEHLARIASQGFAAEQTIHSLLSAIEADMPADQDNTTLIAAYCEGGEGPVTRRRRLRRRALGMAILSLAVLGVALSAYILIADLTQENAAGPERPAARERGRIPLPAPPRTTGEVDGSAFKPLAPARDEGRGTRRPQRPAGARDQVKPPLRRPTRGGVADNADGTGRAGASVRRPTPTPPPPAEAAPSNRAAEATDNRVSGTVLSAPATTARAQQPPDRR
jgi:serine/threonine protein phosphatase PrpC